MVELGRCDTQEEAEKACRELGALFTESIPDGVGPAQARVNSWLLQMVRTAAFQIQFERCVKQPNVQEALLRRVALYCQSAEAVKPKRLADYHLPAPFCSEGLGLAWNLEPDYAFIKLWLECGFAVRLEADRSTEHERVWSLSWCEEFEDPVHLTELTLAPTASFTQQEIDELVCSGYACRIANDPDTVDHRRGQLSYSLRRQNLELAVIQCRTWIEHNPESAEPRVALAHILCRLGQATRADAELMRWLGNNRTLANHLAVAVYRYRENRPMTLDTLRAVLKLKPRPPLGEGLEDHLLNAAKAAYQEEAYELALALCERARSIEQPGWQFRMLEQIRAAVLGLQGDWRKAQRLVDATPPSQVNFRVVQQLRAALSKRETDTLDNPSSWLGASAALSDGFDRQARPVLYPQDEE